MIFLVRHGQTEFNAEGRVQGGLDSALTPLGVEQGKRLGRMFAGLVDPACRIIASPLGRAQHTARLIREHAGLGCEIATDARLAEISLGKWDGQLRDDIEYARPDFDAGRRRFSWYFDAPGGETYEILSARLQSWLDDARKLEGPTIAVSHGVSSRVLRGLFLGLSREDTLKQDVPQDACFRMHEGAIERIAAP
jgi:probable phosphoglycerate mutase